MNVRIIADISRIRTEILVQRLTWNVRERWSYFGSFRAVVAEGALIYLAVAREPCRVENAGVG